MPDGWVISARPAHLALVSEADFIAAQAIKAARRPAPSSDACLTAAGRRYLPAGLLTCGRCGRRMESAWSNGKPAYRCRHGHTSAARPDPARPRNAYVREEIALAQLPVLRRQLTRAQPASPGRGTRSRRRTRGGNDVDRPDRGRRHHRLPARAPGHAHLGPGRGDPARRKPRSHRHARKLTRGQPEQVRRTEGDANTQNPADRPAAGEARATADVSVCPETGRHGVLLCSRDERTDRPMRAGG